MIYLITNIDYDTENLDDLPSSLRIKVASSLDEQEKNEFISNEISNITGFCHKGFSATQIPLSDLNSVDYDICGQEEVVKALNDEYPCGDCSFAIVDIDHCSNEDSCYAWHLYNN